MRLLEMHEESSTDVRIQQLQEISELEVLIGALLATATSSEFSITCADGNLIRCLMKVFEKVGYVETRLMNLVLDEHEAIRQISQVLQTADSTEMMATQVEQIGELWVSARQRTKDTPCKEVGFRFPEDRDMCS